MKEETRFQRLPAWAREELRKRADEIKRLEGTLEAVEAENNRLRVALTGKAEVGGPSDTFHVNDDTGAKLPLGVGASIEFGPAGRFDVRYEAGGLLIESQGAMAIMPDYNQSIFITTDEGKRDSG